MPKLKIVYITPEFLPVRGGVSVYSINLIKTFLSHDIEVHLITTIRDNVHVVNDLNYLDDWRLNIYKVTNFDGGLFSHIKFQYKVKKTLANLIKNIKPDLIHTNFPVNGDILYTLFDNKNIPIITTIHGSTSMLRETIKTSLYYTPKIFLDSSEKTILRYYPFFVYIERLYLQKVSHAIAVSHYAKNMISKYITSDKVSIVYHGIDTSLFDNVDKYNNEPTILLLTRLVAHKGINVFLKALPLILKEIPTIKILIAGGTDSKLALEYIKKTIEKFGNSTNNINFIGYVPNYTELPMLYEKANIFVSPSFEDLLGFRLLEAMSCKCATVATNVGGVPEIIKDGENGLLVNAGDHVMLADKIIMLCQDHSLRKRLSINGRITVMNGFTAEIMASKTLQIYNNIISNVQ
jgi:glycosyltransferase involved in cell wall biosynthesis